MTLCLQNCFGQHTLALKHCVNTRKIYQHKQTFSYENRNEKKNCEQFGTAKKPQ